MKKPMMVLLFFLMTTGCGQVEKVNDVELPTLTEQEKRELDLNYVGETVEFSIDKICVYQEPLVIKENKYDENDKLVEINKYEYDEKNRYKKITVWKSDEEMEMKISEIREYSYDDYFYYCDTTFLDKGDLVTHDIYDSHGNPVQLQVVRKTGEIKNTVYTYRYVVDTDRKHEEYAYSGEGIKFSHYTMKLYDEYGNEYYSLTQYDDELLTKEYEYNYDNAGKILSKIVTGTEEDIGEEEVFIYNISYKYDEFGRMTEELQDNTMCVGRYDETTVKIRRTYEY